MDLRRLIPIAAGLAAAFPLAAGPFRGIGVEDGLSSRKAYQVERDTAGFVWIYTQAGVDRYDGSMIRHYPLVGNVQSRDYIQSATRMLRTPSGGVEIGVKNGHIYRYEADVDDFSLVADLEDALPGVSLYTIFYDHAGVRWLGTGSGAWRWTGDGPVPVFTGQRINVFAETPDGLFIGTDAGVYAGTSDGFVPVAGLGGIDVTSLCGVGDDLFVGTFSSGLRVLHRPDGTVRTVDRRINVPVRALVRYGPFVAAGCDGEGVYVFDPATLALREHWMADDDTADGLCGNTVSDLLCDADGTLWVTTSTNGVCCLRRDVPEVRHIVHERGNPQSLDSDHVNVFCEDSRGIRWYGTNGGVNSYDPATDRWTHYHPTGLPEVAVVLALAEDARGDIWVGGYGFQLFRIDRAGRTHPFVGRPLEYVYALLPEGDALWIGGTANPLLRYDVRTGACTDESVEYVGALGQSGGRLHIASSLGYFVHDSAGIHRVEAPWLRYPVRSLLCSAAGDVWLATDGDGLVHLGADGSVRAYTQADGLSYDSVNSVVEDRQGRIWFATEDELYCLDPVRDALIHANDFLGITHGSFNPAAAAVWSDGLLAFGSAAGAWAFDPSYIDLAQHLPVAPIVTDLYLMGEGRSLPVGTSDGVQLHWRQDAFRVGFSAIDFVYQYRIRFDYTLAGFSAGWEQATAAGDASYANVPPGRYRFVVRTVDRYTGEILGERTFGITVRQPWWRSWWAGLLYGLLAIVAVGLTLRYIRRRREEELIRDKVDSFVSFAHDLKTPVTLIKAPLTELEAATDLSDPAREAVAVARRGTDRLMVMLNQLLDLRNADADGQGLHIGPVVLQEYLDGHLDDFWRAAGDKGLTLSLDVAPGLDTVWTDRQKLDTVVRNLLSNALKYTESGRIALSARPDRHRWRLEVLDTGIGIPARDQRHIFNDTFRAENARGYDDTGYGIGLMVTRQLVHRLRGSIRFRSVEGEGTVFTLSFPLRYREATAPPAASPAAPDPALEPVPEVPDNDRPLLLVADDERDMLDYLGAALGGEYRILTAEDGGAALAMAAEHNPDLVITDVVMPVLHGDALCRRLKADMETSHIPVILLTAMGERESIIYGLESGADDYIVKPFDMSMLRLRIRNILAQRERLRTAILSASSAPAPADYTSRLDREFVDRVLAVVEQELSNPDFSVNDLCRSLAMSRTAFYNKLKSLTGQGPNDFIRICRLNKARELLSTREHTVAEVSDLVGFSDPKYFSVSFKRRFGISPSRI